MNLQTQIEMMRDPTRFTRLFSLLIGAEYPDYQVIDDTRADGGNDGYLPSEKRMFARHCFAKPEKQKDDEAILKKLKSDFAKAVRRKKAGDYDIENWTFVTNYMLPDHIVQSLRELGEAEGVKTIHRGGDYIARLAIKHRHLLEEFPELRQVTLAEEMHARFDGLEEKIPQSPNAKSQLVGEVNEILRELLIVLELYGKKEVNPYLNVVNEAMEGVHEQIESRLGATARLIGEDSDLYKQLEALSIELHGASTADLFADGGHSYRARMKRVDSAHNIVKSLMRDIGQYVTLEGLEDTKADVRRRLARWFDGLDETYNAFFEKAQEQATRLLRIYTYLYQAGYDTDAERYAQLAKDIEALSRDDKSGYGEIMRVEIPKLARRNNLIDLNQFEAELLEEATKHNGQINIIRVDQTPPGHFVRMGDKSYASDTDASIARPYIEALNSLQERNLVEHISGNLFTVTSAGWQKVGSYGDQQ